MRKNRRRFMHTSAVTLTAALLLGGMPPMTLTVNAAVDNGWEEENGNWYWYENGVRQGYDPSNPDYRGKEIYDPQSDAWYWLDNVDQGKKAVSKDVYQESSAGNWADRADGTGKWVRYDEQGHMIKGWSENEGGTYFFDEIYGTMAKGYATIGTAEYYFNPATGIREREFGEVPETGWKNIDGNDYWYEGHVRQGYSVNADYRGKEIFDPASDAWYWLDNVDGGKKAVSKDVYQDSSAGDWAENADGTGKWVRYDSQGHMIKGWSTNENGTYYFDPIYGTMAKGIVTIDGKQYEFDRGTGTLVKEVTGSDTGNGDSDSTETKTADIKWDISEDGKLTVTGTCGSDGKIPTNLWERRKNQITSAYINVEGVTNLNNLFFRYPNLEFVDLSDLDTSSVMSMNGLFYACSSLTSVDLSGFNTGSVKDMGAMFYECRSLESLDVSGFDTSSVTNMGYMFDDCSGLTSLDVSGFDTSSMTYMVFMFCNCRNVTSLDVSGFDTSNVTDMSFMFSDCNSLTSLNVSRFDTGCVKKMASMFKSCSSLTNLNLSGFDTGSVTDMSFMFYNCFKLSEISVGSGWTMDSVTNKSYMFSNCGTDHVTLKSE